MTSSCGVCGDPIQPKTISAVCMRCETPHHHDCWAYNIKDGIGCSIYACGSNKAYFREGSRNIEDFLVPMPELKRKPCLSLLREDVGAPFTFYLLADFDGKRLPISLFDMIHGCNTDHPAVSEPHESELFTPSEIVTLVKGHFYPREILISPGQMVHLISCCEKPGATKLEKAFLDQLFNAKECRQSFYAHPLERFVVNRSIYLNAFFELVPIYRNALTKMIGMPSFHELRISPITGNSTKTPTTISSASLKLPELLEHANLKYLGDSFSEALFGLSIKDLPGKLADGCWDFPTVPGKHPIKFEPSTGHIFIAGREKAHAMFVRDAPTV